MDAAEAELRERIAQELEAESRELDLVERARGQLYGSSAAGVMSSAAALVRQGPGPDARASARASDGAVRG